MLAIDLNKTTLEYLYIQWMVASDQPFNLIAHREFRALLEYINPVANQMLSDSGQTIKVHAEALFYEKKQQLQHVLATFISNIHITCDM